MHLKSHFSLFSIFFALISQLAIIQNLSSEELPQAKLNEQTKNHLLEAMKGEALAHIKYLLFADQARKEGREELAKVFERIADIERNEHLAELAKLYGLVGSSQENLKAALGGETYETQQMYPEFAKQAEQVGDQEAAQRFSEIAKDEKLHRDAFQAELKALRQK